MKHPTVTLAQLGVAHGDAVEFLADLEAAAPSRGGTGEASRVELQVTLADKLPGIDINWARFVCVGLGRREGTSQVGID